MDNEYLLSFGNDFLEMYEEIDLVDKSYLKTISDKMASLCQSDAFYTTKMVTQTYRYCLSKNFKSEGYIYFDQLADIYLNVTEYMFHLRYYFNDFKLCLDMKRKVSQAIDLLIKDYILYIKSNKKMTDFIELKKAKELNYKIMPFDDTMLFFDHIYLYNHGCFVDYLTVINKIKRVSLVDLCSKP